MFVTRRWRILLAVLPLFIAPREVLAEDAKHRCAAAAEAAQVARLDGKLSRALESATACDARECPRIVRNDCHEWRTALEPVVPFIFVHVVAEDGSAVPNARVRLDGAPFDTLEQDIRLDPGKHEVAAEAGGFETKTLQFVAKEGERRHVIDVILRKEARAATVALAPPAAVHVPSERAPATPLPIRIGLFGLAGAGLATFFISGVPAYFEVQHLQRSCAPFCNSSELDGARTRMIIGDVGLGIGVVALAAGAWLTFFGPKKEIPVVFAPTVGGAAFAISGKMP